MRTQPDISCKTGDEVGQDIWMWQCLDGKHVVIWQSSFIFHRGPAHKEVSECGTSTEIEQSEDLVFWNYPDCVKPADPWR